MYVGLLAHMDLKFVIGIAAVIFVLFILFVSPEGFRDCDDCDKKMPSTGVSVINPFVWPYSGTSHVDDLYILNHDNGVDLGFKTGPLYSLNTPDHVELV